MCVSPFVGLLRGVAGQPVPQASKHCACAEDPSWASAALVCGGVSRKLIIGTGGRVARGRRVGFMGRSRRKRASGSGALPALVPLDHYYAVLGVAPGPQHASSLLPLMKNWDPKAVHVGPLLSSAV